jgi:hypothetical protein
MLGLALLESRFPFPGISTEITDMLIVLVAFGTMLAWVQINLGVIEHDEMQQDNLADRLKITVYKPHAPLCDEEEELEPREPALSAQPEIQLERVGSVKRADESTWHLN